MPKRVPDMMDNKFGMLMAYETVGYNEQAEILRRFICDCGKEIILRQKSVRAGLTTSCGCFKRSELVKRNTKHGHASRVEQHPLYSVWNSMRTRCNNPERDNYSYYGGRGIKVCPEWDSFEQFLTDMGERPNEHYLLERRDNNGNYEKSNCYWATAQEQANNRRPRGLAEHENILATI